MSVGIIDYGVGNVGNVLRAMNRIGRTARLVPLPDDVSPDISILLLPGVGAFAPARERLRQAGWDLFLRQWAEDGFPLLGICLGMQLLCQRSHEGGNFEGLGIIDGTIEHLKTRKCPHMGWNSILWARKTSGLSFSNGEYFYFVHSYALLSSRDTAAVTKVEDKTFASVVQKKRVMGFQFHPERSGKVGLKLLDASLRYLEKQHGRISPLS